MLVKQYNLILTDGGMGDLLGELVAVDWIVKTQSGAFHVWLPDYLFEFARHLLPSRCVVHSFKDEILFNKSFPTRTTEWSKYNCTPMRIHAVDYGFITLADRLPKPEERNYLKIQADKINISRFDLPEKYIVLQGAFAEAVKTMPVETFAAVVNWALAKGYTPVFVGREESDTGFKDFKVRGNLLRKDVYAKGINLINKTSLLETAAVIAGAKCYVGMEGGVTHLAGFTDTPIVAGFTLGDPFIHSAPLRCVGKDPLFFAVEPGKNVKNRYFQTYSTPWNPMDNRKFPGWEDVVATMTADKFTAVLNRVLEEI